MLKSFYVVLLAGVVALATSCSKPCPCEQEVVTLTEQNANTTEALGKSMADMDSVLNAFEQIDALKAELSALPKDSSATERAKQINEALNKVIERSETRIADLDKALAKSKKQKRALQKVVANLKTQLTTTKQQVAELQGKVSELEGTVAAQTEAIAAKEAELSETKGSNEALNATLRETQRKAFIKEGEGFMERGRQAEANGDGLNRLVNGKKKKAQYEQAVEFYQKAVDHYSNIPGGLGGFAGDAEANKDIETKKAEAQKLLDQVKEKLK